jgi:paired amphipathic helix protein Sin3a
MCRAVLNDVYVSHPFALSAALSQDSSAVAIPIQPSKRAITQTSSSSPANPAGYTYTYVPPPNPALEALHRTEEERHEYDFHIDAITRTIAVLEPINMKISALQHQAALAAQEFAKAQAAAPNGNSPAVQQAQATASQTADTLANFKLKPNWNGTGKPIHFRTLRKLYGQHHGTLVIQSIQEQPQNAVPVVLARLKSKEQEWRAAKRAWGPVWKYIESVNGGAKGKALDVQGQAWKAKERKMLGGGGYGGGGGGGGAMAKWFVGQVESVKEERRRRGEGDLFGGRKRAWDLEISFEEPDVVIDGPEFTTLAERASLEEEQPATVPPSPVVAGDETHLVETLHQALKLTLSFLDRTQDKMNLNLRRRIEIFLRSFVPLFWGFDVVTFNDGFNATITYLSAGISTADADVEMSDIEVASTASVPSATAATASTKRGRKPANGGEQSASGDLRKKLLKSEQAKSSAQNRKTRGSGGSRTGTPLPLGDDDSVMGLSLNEGVPQAAETPRKTPRKKSVFFANTNFYVLLRLIEVKTSLFSLLPVSDDLCSVDPLCPPGAFQGYIQEARRS